MYLQIKRATMALFLSLFCFVAYAQQTVTGTVKDATGEPLIGVTVLMDGQPAAITDLDGNFTIDNAKSSSVIKVTYVGYMDQQVTVGNKTHFNITMKEDDQSLDEVVVVGYGTMKKSDLTGSVSSVSTDKLNAKGAPSVMENLQGATPGVNITQSTGRTGGDFNIEIRGKSSINASTSPLYVVDGVMCDDIQFLNPQDIERIDVLKDASSTAIYGSRATAGVVMVTTKSGASVGKNAMGQHKVSVSYDGYYGLTKAVRMPDFQDGQSFYNYRMSKFLTYAAGDEASANGQHIYSLKPQNANGIGQALLAVDNKNPYENYVLKNMLASGETYNWPDIVTRDGRQQNHYLAVSGSGENLNYHMGVGYNNEKGIYQGDEQTRINFKGSLDAKLSKLVSVGFSFNMAHIDNSYASDYGIQNAYYMVPFIAPYYTQSMKDRFLATAADNLAAGTWTQERYDTYVESLADIVGKRIYQPGQKEALGTNDNNFTSSRNPLNLMRSQASKRETWRMLGNFYMEFRPLKGLSYKTTFSPNYTYYRQGSFDGYINDFIDPVAGQTTALAYDDANYTNGDNKAVMLTNRAFSWTWDNVINYNTTINKDHSINLMGLYSMQASNVEKWQGTYKKVMEGTDWWNLNTGEYDSSNSSNSWNENSMISYALRANYAYQGKYMATATVRWDGSSKFTHGHRWGSFPSFALAWRASEEKFLKDVDWLSNLKLRLSYGVTGNCDGISNYPTFMSPSGPVYYQYGGTVVNGYYINNIADLGLQWEKSYEYNAGLDFGFFKNRINGSVDVYQKTSKDLLYPMTLPLAGYSMTTNVGKVRNRGIEVALNGVIISNKDWYWETSLTFSHNKNKVMEINGTGQDLPADNLFIGQPFNNVYGFSWDGVVSDRDMKVPNTAIALEKGLTPGTTMKEYDYYYTCYGWSEGMPKINDINGDGKFDDNDKTVRKSDPSWTGTFTSNLSYKNWDFSFSIYAKQHYTVESSFMNKYMEYGQRGQLRYNMDYYIPAGTLIDCDGINADGTYINPVYQEGTHYGAYPFPNYGGDQSGMSPNNTEYLDAVSYVDASFVKVKNITLGYTFPKSWINKFGCHHLRLYCTVTNPFVFTDYKGFDPEWAGASLKNDGPSTMTWQFGANIKF
jgi:TonB-linked SusC/RagA family outer membrane protein